MAIAALIEHSSRDSTTTCFYKEEAQSPKIYGRTSISSTKTLGISSSDHPPFRTNFAVGFFRRQYYRRVLQSDQHPNELFTGLS